MNKDDLKKLMAKRDHVDQMLDAALRLRVFYEAKEADAREEGEYRRHIAETYDEDSPEYQAELERSMEDWEKHYYYSWGKSDADDAAKRAKKFAALETTIRVLTEKFAEWFAADSTWQAFEDDWIADDVLAWYDERRENCLPEVYDWHDRLCYELVADTHKYNIAADAPAFERDDVWFTDDGFIGRV